MVIEKHKGKLMKIAVVINKGCGECIFSKEAELWVENHAHEYNAGVFYDIYDLPRHHPLLVDCVRELGKRVNGSRWSDIKVEYVCVDADDSFEYVIINKDNHEVIITKYHMKSVNLKESSSYVFI